MSHEDYGVRLEEHALRPLWDVLKATNPAGPRASGQAPLWRWNVVRPFLQEARTIVSAEEAGRRALVLENPAFAGKAKATPTLHAAIQTVKGHETAPPHRHSQSALRFVLESQGGYTMVDGHRLEMRRGDFVITPPWSVHSHGNDADQPASWLDVLDVPLAGFLETGFFEESGDLPALQNHAHGIAGLASHYVYPYTDRREALRQATVRQEIDPQWGATLRYESPQGGWALPTIASWLAYVPPGVQTAPFRSTDALILAVAEGSGTFLLDGKPTDFSEQDVFVAPNWTWRSFSSEEGCVLFCSSDRAAQERLGFWREEQKS